MSTPGVANPRARPRFSRVQSPQNSQLRRHLCTSQSRARFLPRPWLSCREGSADPSSRPAPAARGQLASQTPGRWTAQTPRHQEFNHRNVKAVLSCRSKTNMPEIRQKFFINIAVFHARASCRLQGSSTWALAPGVPSARRRARRAPPPERSIWSWVFSCLAGASTRANRAQDQHLDGERGAKIEGHPTQYPTFIAPWRPVPHLASGSVNQSLSIAAFHQFYTVFKISFKLH